jgi:hypothetical protein
MKRVRELGKGGVQSYLIEQVELHGGVAEHFETPGKVGPPDLLVIWPHRLRWSAPDIHFVETKTEGGVLKPWQKRDHARRRKLGCIVAVIWSVEQADNYVRRHGTFK